MASLVRSESEIIGDSRSLARNLEALVQSPGYRILLLHYGMDRSGDSPSAEEVLERNPHDHLSNSRAIFRSRTGQTSHNPRRPPSKKSRPNISVYQQLMEELHGAHLRPNVTSLPPSPDELEGWLHSGPSMVEAIFYGEEGAYPSMLRLAPRRYRKDAEWIQNFLGTSLETIIDRPIHFCDPDS